MSTKKSKKKVYKKKHKKINGQCFHTNKRWSDLKDTQKEFIITTFNNKYTTFLVENNRIPTKDEKSDIINEVYSLVEERDIWIPFGEVKAKCQGKMNKLNRKHIKK